MFIRTENFREFIRLYPIVSFLLFINIALYLIFQISLWLHIAPIINLYQIGIGSNLGVREGQWWRLITPLFLHFTFMHILFNAFSIFLFAPALEIILGKVKFLIAYLGSGIISDGLSAWFGDLNLSYIGASASIFGLFGIYLFMLALRRDLIDRMNRQMIGIIVLISVISTFITPQVDILGHLFGLLGGFILGPILLTRKQGTW